LDSQAPEDAAAGGGGGACVVNDTQTTVGGDTGRVCCENAGWFPVAGSYANETTCQEDLNQTICGEPVSTYINAWNASSETCDGTGSSCTNNPPGTVGVCYYGNAGQGRCIYTEPSKCLYFEGSSLRCDCGCPTKEEVCAGETGNVPAECPNCGNTVVYECGDDIPPEDPPDDEPPGDDPDPICGDGVVDPGEQCDDGNQINGDGCNNNCQIEEKKSICGQTCESDSDCLPGTTGAATVCRNGICEAERCSPGNTVYGTRCDCADLNQTCGQRCGGNTGLGLCGGGAIPTSCAYIDGPSCRSAANGAEETYCAPIGQSANQTGPTPNPDIERQKCVARDQSNSYVIYTNESDQQITDLRSFTAEQRYDALCRWCGNGILDPGEECDYGQDNGTLDCNQNCELVEPPDEAYNATIIKNSSEVCGPNDEHIINYDIQIVNTGEIAVDVFSLDDVLPSGLGGGQISNISDGGQYNSSNNTITWDSSNLGLPLGGTLEFTYTVTLTQDQGDQLGEAIENTVTVVYGPGDEDIQEKSYVNIQPLECAPGVDLPRTNLADNIMYFVAGTLLILGILAYNRRIGADEFDPILTDVFGKVNKTTKKIVNPKKSYESEILEQE
jgi:cysteine-rich repeat protein